MIVPHLWIPVCTKNLTIAIARSSNANYTTISKLITPVNIQQPFIIVNIDLNKHRWLGRKFHSTKRTDHIRLQAILAISIAAMTTLSLIWAPLAAAVLPGVFVAGMGFFAIRDARKKNKLEKALVHLVGGKDKLEQLPVVNCVDSNKGFLEIKLEAMRQNVMRVTHKGKTHGVAFKYAVIQGENEPDNTCIRLYLLNEPFHTGTLWRGYRFISEASMSSVEGEELEKMIRRNILSDRSALE